MKLKEHVEAIMLLLNNKMVGPYLFLENGSVINKNDIEHFVVLHALKPEFWEEGSQEGIFKRTFNKETDLSEAEQFAKLEENVEEVNVDEQSVVLDDDAVLRLIARNRNINCPSLSILRDDGWFICPVFKGMDGLYPCTYKKLAGNKGYSISVSNKPIFEIDPKTFNEENFKDWELNSMFMLNGFLEQNSKNKLVLSTQTIFVHKKTNQLEFLIKKAMDRLQITQKTRIKLGNILINEVLSIIGQEAYAQNKENLAKSVKKNSEVSTYDIQDIKIIDKIVEAYKKINKLVQDKGKNVPIRLEKTFYNIIKELNVIEEQEHVERAKKYQEGKDITLEEAMKATSILRSSDYISSFVTYINTQIYLQMNSVETDAQNMVAKLVHQHPFWNTYFEGIRGIGELSAGAIIADIDFRSTVHPSAVIRYLGLDNIIEVPNRENEVITDDDLARTIRYLFNDYNNINIRVQKSNSLNIPKFEEKEGYTWDHFYKTDAIETYEEFSTVKEVYTNPLLGSMNIKEISKKFPKFNELIDKTWRRFTIIDNIKDGMVVPQIKKRARNKSDKVLTTYLDKNGKVSTKYSLGYNSELKAKILQVVWENLQKTHNEYYVNEVYLPYRARLEERFRREGKDPNEKGIKGRIFYMARRHAIQRFIEDMWKNCRQICQYPLNGGTYYEAKLGGIHKHGLNPALQK